MPLRERMRNSSMWMWMGVEPAAVALQRPDLGAALGNDRCRLLGRRTVRCSPPTSSSSCRSPRNGALVTWLRSIGGCSRRRSGTRLLSGAVGLDATSKRSTSVPLATRPSGPRPSFMARRFTQDQLGAQRVLAEIDHDVAALARGQPHAVHGQRRLQQVAVVGDVLEVFRVGPVHEVELVEAGDAGVDEAEAVLAALHPEVRLDLAVDRDLVAPDDPCSRTSG